MNQFDENAPRSGDDDPGIQARPMMEGSEDATNHEKLAGLVEQVDNDHGHEGAGSMAEHLRDRMEETKVAPEEAGDSEE
jgi:hypothetical protein